MRTAVALPSPAASLSASLPRASSRRHGIRVHAAAETDKYKPDWAGEDTLSKVVNAAINFKPLFAVMKVMAKNTMKSTAEKNGIAWDGTVRDYEQGETNQQLVQIKSELEDTAMEYPEYYVQQFHGYTQGNLNWLAAFEAIPATDCMCMRVYKDEDITPFEAQGRVRGGIFGAIKDFAKANDCRPLNDMLDGGCSVGVSTRWMAMEWPEAKVTGLDLSPYFLAVAELEERKAVAEGKARGVQGYVHGNLEATGYPDASFDLVTITFTLHECPQGPTRNILKEARRLLRPGGIVAITDNDPKSPVIQNLPPVLFTLMKSTEPHSDDYYTLDFNEALLEAGFDVTHSARADPRHRTVMGRAGPRA